MGFSYSLPADLQRPVSAALADWRAGDKIRRLWQNDKSLWTSADEDHWLGWLDLVEPQPAAADELAAFADEIRAEFTHALLLGMGGSSLGPEVLTLTFGAQPGFPRLQVLDSTDPSQVAAIEQRLDLPRTLFMVASKSGSTLEPNLFMQYFWQRAAQASGLPPGRQFIAITDPGSKLEATARARGFRRIFHGVPSVGGRYSVLSNFGLVPAAVMGLDVKELLARCVKMVKACRNPDPVENPGAIIGVLLGALGSAGRDKVTLVASGQVCAFGAWLEQLLAESTGKNGKGLIPVDLEALGPPEVYGADRVFVDLHLAGDSTNAAAFDALIAAGHPVVRVEFDDLRDCVPEFFCWEFGTAVAGSLLGINPFDQPDVEASKIKTRALTEAYETTGALPGEQPFHEEAGIQLFADQANVNVLRGAGFAPSLSGYLRAHLRRLQPDDYFALLAYVEMNESHPVALQSLRHAVRNAHHVATCLGFGPRFLHSTGQVYKGGPNTGVFLQITCDDAHDLPVPGQQYTFGVVKAAQARGDFDVLTDRGRRVLRVHLTGGVLDGLAKLLRVLG